MKKSTEYMDQVYEFKGLWDRSSKCGLKVVEKGERIIVIATELYNENPGTSITKWSAQLATEICKKYNAEPANFVFIEHAPNMNSKLSFYDEAFYKVIYRWEGDKFVDPQYESLTKEQVDNIIA